MVNRREFLAGAAAWTAGTFSDSREIAGVAASSASATRPNILIFMPDQTQGNIVLPGHPCLTPNLSRFASQGVVFRNAYCPSPHCCPSRASFQTGLYPSEHGVFNNVDTASAIHRNPNAGVPFFAQILRNSGYELDYCGKWHVGHDLTSQDAGWRNSFTENVPRSNRHMLSARPDAEWREARSGDDQRGPRQFGEIIRPGWGNVRLFKTLASMTGNGFEASIRNDRDAVTAGTIADHEVVVTSTGKLRQLAGVGRPWALMVSNSGAHDPYVVPKNFLDMYNTRQIELPASFRDTLEDKPRIYGRMRYQYWDQMSDEEVRQCVLHYWAKVTMQDAWFGVLLRALEETGQADNTMVLYISDHGDYAGAHGLWAKGVPSFSEAYHIPCVVRWPRGAANPGREVEAFVSTTDLAPTFLEAAGVSPEPYKMSGRSLIPWLRDETPPRWRDAIFSQLNGVELYYTQRAVMTQDYKYVYNGFDFDELYDLKEDPLEMKNLAFPDKLQMRRQENGSDVGVNANYPWPPLAPKLNEVRRTLLKRMWEFADEHQDQIFNSYLTVAMAPYGPGVALD